jgi:hypothetical protein
VPYKVRPAWCALFMARASVEMTLPMAFHRVLLKVAPVWIT